MRLGPSRLLTGTLPVDPSGPELATISTIAGFTALIAVRLALGPRNAWLPLLPPLCCLLLGLGLSATVGAPAAWYGPVFAVVAMAVVLAGREAALAGALGKGRLVTGAAVVLIATASGLVLGPLVAADRPPTSLQALVDAPVLPKEDTNPMARYLALRDNLLPLEIAGTASERLELIRMVTLDRFDGQTWTIGASYRRAGTRLSTPDSAVPTRDVSLDLQVLTPDSVGWLPRVGRPTQISVADLGFDATSGDVVVPADRNTPAAYRITGREPILEANDVGIDDPATSEASRLPLPPEVLAFVDTATAGRSAGLGQLLGLYQAMTSTSGFSYDNSPQARGGHGVRQITDLVNTKRGTSEQYASMFALLSRHLGWDARVVLGFRPTWDGDRLHIRGANVFAWAEVRFQRLGWIPVNPSPTQSIDGQGKTVQQPTPADALDDIPSPDQQVPEEPPDATADAQGDLSSQPANSMSGLATLATIVAIALVLCLGLIPLVRIVRRRRARNNGTPRRRTIAAWRDTIDALRWAGIPVGPRSTTGQVIGVVHGPLQPFLRPLAEIVDRAAYSPEGILDHAAELAWQCNDAIRTELHKGMSFGRRLSRLLDPRTLLPTRTMREYQTTP
ncbi:MAG TPA: transglutaminase domain-containing protein [Actinophytocola sp.]|nr:transglutaminase domain-containing protein [Actinophytocola sp.]